ncbi:hypothetical protein GCM10009789_41780 [Kribbella sancticallisti]|uniref:Uncharacterized protein n=1 Tax=Kribbella sancticallisti TaxID=460087 RepID=A0ABN2DSX2_9ACTN
MFITCGPASSFGTGTFRRHPSAVAGSLQPNWFATTCPCVWVSLVVVQPYHGSAGMPGYVMPAGMSTSVNPLCMITLWNNPRDLSDIRCRDVLRGHAVPTTSVRWSSQGRAPDRR